MTQSATLTGPSIDEIRAKFPGIAASNDALLDNAGGSQVPASVADAMHRYMTTNYVQLGAGYETSQRCTALVKQAHAFVELFMGAGDAGSVILGGSMTGLCNMLADCVARSECGGRDQIVVSELAHESNAGPWERLGQRGFDVRVWEMDRDSRQMRLNDLETLLSERTRIVAMPHVSNIYGTIEDVEGAIELAHAVGAEVVIDGVALAPHRAMNVAPLGADWYSYATYKVFGPHMGALFGTHEAMAKLPSAYHDFIPHASGAYRFELGGANHEGCAGLLGLWDYLAFLGGGNAADEPSRAVIERAFDVITHRETALQALLIEQLTKIPGVRLIGPASAGPERVSTVSFACEDRKSKDIVFELNRADFGVRYGNFYSRRMCCKLSHWGDLHDVDDGVVRVSLLHYNTEAEVEGLCSALEGLPTRG